MKKRNPDQYAAEFIANLNETQPARHHLGVNARPYTNQFSIKILKRLMLIIMQRLMPLHAVDVFGMFLGCMSESAMKHLRMFYGEDCPELSGPSMMKFYKRYEKGRT